MGSCTHSRLLQRCTGAPPASLLLLGELWGTQCSGPPSIILSRQNAEVCFALVQLHKHSQQFKKSSNKLHMYRSLILNVNIDRC